jgi:maltodextrin utilization protein YvdJ
MEQFDLKKFLVENKLTTNSKLVNEAQEMDMVKSFLESKQLKVEEVKTGNIGDAKAKAESAAEGTLKDKAFIWDAEGMAKYNGKDYIEVWVPYNKELKEEIKSKFPVLDIGGRTGSYFTITIEKK